MLWMIECTLKVRTISYFEWLVTVHEAASAHLLVLQENMQEHGTKLFVLKKCVSLVPQKGVGVPQNYL